MCMAPNWEGVQRWWCCRCRGDDNSDDGRLDVVVVTRHWSVLSVVMKDRVNRGMELCPHSYQIQLGIVGWTGHGMERASSYAMGGGGVGNKIQKAGAALTRRLVLLMTSGSRTLDPWASVHPITQTDHLIIRKWLARPDL